MASREIDTGNFPTAGRPPAAEMASASGPRRIRLDSKRTAGAELGPTDRPAATMAGTAGTAGAPPAGSLIGRALSMVRSERARASSFEAARHPDESDFIADPVLQRTSSAAQIVHFQQFYRGIPLFRTGSTVRFAPQGKTADVLGESVTVDAEIDTMPTLSAVDAVAAAARHLASATSGKETKDEFGETSSEQPLKLDGFEPKVVVGFPMLPTQPTVVDWIAAGDPQKKLFSKPIPAHLLIFDQPGKLRLGWYTVFSREEQYEQYAVIVSADAKPGEILYAKDMMHNARARGNVFEFSPGVADRVKMDMPRPIGDYPMMPSAPLAGFPTDWIDAVTTAGNSTVATLNFGLDSLSGRLNGNVIEFNPEDQFGDDQKLLNIFYFCNYMHDFLFILGFNEAAGNFQRVNLTHSGMGGDPVTARAHSGAVRGTANMSTAADGTPPVMNMGLVTRTNRHTAFDSQVVFHEYTHGLTNRLVGGTRLGHTLDAPQSRGMGEGWSDFFALTIENFFRAKAGQREKVVIGDWIVNNDKGLRSNPYDDNYPFTYGNVGTFERLDDTGLPDEHQTGEIWCAALMMMVRRIRAFLGNDIDGYRLGWQIVVDGLKLAPSNPSFLQARDAILLAVDHMLDQARISRTTHDGVRQAALTAFGRFGMGPNATSPDSGVDGIVEDVVTGAVA